MDHCANNPCIILDTSKKFCNAWNCKVVQMKVEVPQRAAKKKMIEEEVDGVGMNGHDGPWF